jgi:hypothetical protein
LTERKKTTPASRLNQYELHLYETYWAPKTEGVANLTDVVSFLWDGGVRGMLNSVKSFRRAMFGGMATFYIPWFTPLWLLLARRTGPWKFAKLPKGSEAGSAGGRGAHFRSFDLEAKIC